MLWGVDTDLGGTVSRPRLRHSSNILSQLWCGQRKMVLLLVLGSALLSIVQLDTFQVGAGNDDAHYIVLARSLSAGTGYRLINYPHAPVEPAFPPGWSLLLTPLVTLFPESFIPLKLLSLFFWLASILLAYRLFSYHLRTPYLEALLALIALNPALIHWSGLVMSEHAYLFFSLLTLNLFEAWNQNRKKYGGALLLIAILAAGLTILVRTVGITLLAAILLYLSLNLARRKTIMIGGLLALIFIPLVWFYSPAGGISILSETYSQHFTYVTSRLPEFLQFWKYYTFFSYEAIAAFLVPIFDLRRISNLLTPELNLVLSICTLLVLLLGFLLSIRDYLVKDIYVTLYLGLFYVWIAYTANRGHQSRLILPILPFLYFYFLRALDWLAMRALSANKKLATNITVSLVIAVTLLLLVRNFHEWRNPIRDRITDLSIGTTWVNKNTPPDATVMTVNAVADHLYAKRKTVDFPPEDVDVEEHLRKYGVDYIIVKPHLQVPRTTRLSEEVEFYVLPYVESNQDQFKEVYRNEAHNVSVYQVLRQNDPATRGAGFK